MSYKSLIINPGSTSTKIGVFEDETLLFEETLRHSTEEIAQYDSIVAQKDFRKDVIAKVLAENNFDIVGTPCPRERPASRISNGCCFEITVSSSGLSQAQISNP